MTELLIEGELADQLWRIAEQEHRSPQAVLRALLSGYRADSAGDLAFSSEAVKARLYARARHTWQQAGDSERLTLTDAQLDAQFWGFDAEDNPRLKSDSISETPAEGLLADFAAAAEKAGFAAGSQADDRWEDDFATHLLRYRQSPHGE